MFIYLLTIPIAIMSTRDFFEKRGVETAGKVRTPHHFLMKCIKVFGDVYFGRIRTGSNT